MSIVHEVPDGDMPQLFQAADAASIAGQRTYVRGIQIRLCVLVLAAFISVASVRIGSHRVDVLALISFGGFIIALVVEVSLWRTRPDRAWYDGRAVAESAKTLAWKFAVCAQPFPRYMSDADANRAFIEQSELIRDQFDGLELEAINAAAISDWMSEQRKSTLQDRRVSYIEARIGHQRIWYTAQARYNKRRTRQWRLALMFFELLGAISSLYVAIYTTIFSVAGIITSIIAAVVAWTETKQHESNSRAYSAAVVDLSNAEVKLALATTEIEWAQEVDDAEEAISREHVVWLATRSKI